jgi:hypothetical protein
MAGGGNDVHFLVRPAGIRVVKGCECLEYRLKDPVIVLLGHAAQIEQAGAVVDAGEHGRVTGTQGSRKRFGELECPPRQGNTGCPAAADPTVVRDDRHLEGIGEPVGTAPQLCRVRVQRLDNR